MRGGGGKPKTFYLYPHSLEKAPQVVPACPEYYACNMKQATCFMICLMSAMCLDITKSWLHFEFDNVYPDLLKMLS